MVNKKECQLGYGCGLTCINRENKCRDSLQPTINDLTNKVASTIISGNYGRVSLYDNLALKEGDIGQQEVKIQSIMADGGFAPKIHEVADGKVLMERAQGKPVWADYRASDEEKANDVKLTVAQSQHLGQALEFLHRNGYQHGDLHVKQVLQRSDSDKITLIDYGLSTPINNKAWQDITKSVPFARYEEVDTPWAKKVVGSLEEYRTLKTSKADKVRKQAIADEYLEWVSRDSTA